MLRGLPRVLLIVAVTTVGVLVVISIASPALIDWTAVGSIAAAFGALAAWQAAAKSAETGRAALEALAIAIRPSVQQEVVSLGRGNNPIRLTAGIFNVSQWEATRVSVEVRLRDGTTLNGGAERLTPVPPGILKAKDRSSYAADVDHIEIDIGDPTPNLSTHERVESVVVRYSDARNIARYEERFLYRMQVHPVDERGFSSTSSWIDRESRQIAGPGAPGPPW